MKIFLVVLFAIFPILFSCSSKQITDKEIVGQSTGSFPMRRLAWMEGDIQNDYQPDRKVAEEKLQEFKNKIPEMVETDAYLEYLSVLDTSGKSIEAEKKTKLYLASHPQEKRAVFLLGVHYLRIKKKELALHFFRGLENDKTFAWKSLLFNNMGMLALQEKNRREAIDYFERATKVEPLTAAPFVNLGALYLQSRSYNEAYRLFARATSIDEGFEDAYLGLGASLEGLGKFEEAHGIYAQHIDKNPNALSVLYNDSIILGNRLKRRDEAAQQLLRYIQRGGKETAKAHEIIQGWR